MGIFKDLVIGSGCIYAAFGMADHHSEHGLQPTQIGPPLAPITQPAPPQWFKPKSYGPPVLPAPQTPAPSIVPFPPDHQPTGIIV